MSRFSTPCFAVLTVGSDADGERGGLVRAFLAAGALLSLAVLAGLSLTAGSARAAFPGDNGRIACSGALGTFPPPSGQSALEIFTINPDGSGETRLTTNTNSDFQPKWTADGTKIAFTRDNQVWTMNADGTGAAQLTGVQAGQGNNNPGGWSPDGTQLVFQSTRTGNFEVFKMNADGSNQVNLTNNPPAPGQPAATGSDSLPNWSPDGTKIVFQSGRAGNPDLLTMNPDGSGVTNLTAGSADEESGPHWSPDGRQIVYHSDRLFRPRPQTRNLEIWRMPATGLNPDGSGGTRLTFNDFSAGGSPTTPNFDLTGFDLFPAWSPEGDRIVFHSGRAAEHRDTGQSGIIGQWEVYTINAVNGENPEGGSPATRLTNRPGNDERCDWQTIPRQILTVTKTGSGQGSVTSAPPGIDCGAVCSDDFSKGTQVTLSATPAAGSIFTGFSGEGCSGTATSCTVTMDQARSVTATFESDLDRDGLIDASDACPTSSDVGRPLDPRNGCPDLFKPVLSDLRPRPRNFEAATTGASIAAVGSNIRYRLSEPASVRFTVDRTLPGRREVRGASCLKPTRGNRDGKPCLRYVAFRVAGRVASFVDTGTEGFNTFRFTGRLGGRKLDPGHYRLAGVATDLAGNRSRVKRALFRILED